MCPDWETNPQPFDVWDQAPTNWAIWHLAREDCTFIEFFSIFCSLVAFPLSISLFQAKGENNTDFHLSTISSPNPSLNIIYKLFFLISTRVLRDMTYFHFVCEKKEILKG